MTSQWVPTMMQHHENGKIQSFSHSYCINMDSERQMTRKDTPFSVPYVLQCPPVVSMNVQIIPPFVHRKQELFET